jgi:glycosyltransferase involved in cell wall biosynthesis
MKKRLMIFCDAYLPGERGGGGMWAIRNLVERFSDRYDFFIVTRDCDGRIDDTPYVRILRNTWTKRSEAMVYYASPANLNARKFADLVEEINPDAIYLNSVLSKPCVRFLLARRIYFKRPYPLLLAACGELAPAAMQLSAFKKGCFLAAGKLAGIFRGIVWKAANEAERNDIRRVMGNVPVAVAPELSPIDILPDFSLDEKPEKRPGVLKLVFFSRVTPIKNLDFLLKLLEQNGSGSIQLDVVGPTDEPDYLEKCQMDANRLHGNIEVNFFGGLARDAALEVIKTAHFMVLPTKSENFGYVIIEALAAGCPVLLSDQVSWSDVETKGAGWLLPLTSVEEWQSTLERCLRMDASEYRRMSFSAREFAVKYLNAEEPAAVNGRMFDSVLAAPQANG